MNHLKLMKKLYKMEIFIKQLHIQQQLQQDKNGHYKFEGLPEGEYTVVLNHLIKHL